MDIVKFVAIGIISVVLSLTVKKQSPQFSLMISIAASVLIFILILPRLAEVLDTFKALAEMIDANISYIMIILKIIGIAYIAEFGSQICIDAGESAIASKIELSGKILIMFISTPILLSLLDMIFGIMPQ